MTSDLSVVRGQWQVASQGVACRVLREVLSAALCRAAAWALGEAPGSRRRGRFGKKFRVFPGISTYFRIFPDKRGKNAFARARFSRELCERREWRQMRVLKMEKRICKLHAISALRMRSTAFCRMPPPQNVRLLFAFCSHKFLFFLFMRNGNSPLLTSGATRGIHFVSSVPTGAAARCGERALPKRSKLPMEARAEDGDGAAIAIEGGMVDELVIRSEMNGLPDLAIVIGLDGLFDAVVERAVAGEDTIAAGGEESAMDMRCAAENSGH